MDSQSSSCFRFAALLVVAAIIASYIPAARAGFLPAVNCAERNRLIDPKVTAWDVALDFSNSCNPTGQWGYGSTPTLGGSFTLFTRTGTITFQVINGAVGEWVGTYLQGGEFFPIIAKYYGDPGTTVSVVGGNAQQDDQEQIIIQSRANGIVMHPTLPGLGYGVIRWTAPKSATYVISVSYFSAQDDSGTISATSDVHVQRNHVSVFDGFVDQVGVVEKYSTGSRGIVLNAGDVIDLVIGPNGDLTGDSTSVEAQIQELPEQELPEVLSCTRNSNIYEVVKPSNSVSSNVSPNISGIPSICAIPSTEPADWFIKTTTDGGVAWQWVDTLGSLGLGKN
jgi:hypothetical protein